MIKFWTYFEGRTHWIYQWIWGMRGIMDDSEYFLVQAMEIMELPSTEMTKAVEEKVLDEVTFRTQFGSW